MSESNEMAAPALPIRVSRKVPILRIVASAAVVAVALGVMSYMTLNEPPNRNAGSPLSAAAGIYNDFDVDNASIPIEEIFSGGPPRDGIPAILNPKFAPINEIDFMKDADLVVGFVHNGEQKAYPLRVLVWHEIAIDTVGGLPIAITYCPLCGTCIAFDRRIGGQELTFGVSGLLYNSDVLMYDHQTLSLWSQLKMESVSGKSLGKKLSWLATEQMTWAAWKDKYPDSVVLTTETGSARSYSGDAYRGYFDSPDVMFPVPKNRTELAQKDWVVGVIVNDVAKAYSQKALEAAAGGSIEDTVGGTTITISHDPGARFTKVTNGQTGETIPSVNVYWFAWQAFYPQTELFLGK